MTNGDQQAKFEGWAIIDIMGHQRVAGYVTTEAFGAVVMFKVVQAEIPPTETVLERSEYIDGEHCPAGSKIRISRERAESYVGAGSVYRMTPCTEEQAVKTQPMKVEILEKAERKQLAPVLPGGDPQDPDEDGEDDDFEVPF